MYTYCRIMFLDDSSEIDVIIKADEEIDLYDDEIFYYGLSSDNLKNACKSKEPIDGEWIVLSVGETFDVLP